MAATSSVKRFELQGVYDDALEAGSDLLTALKSVIKSFRNGSANSGLVVISTSASGMMTTRSLPSTKDMTTDDWRELYQELREVYDDAKTYLIAAGDPSPTDAEILAQMKSLIETVTSFSSDFSGVIR